MTPFLTKTEGYALNQYTFGEVKKLLLSGDVRMYDTLVEASSASLAVGTILQVSPQTDPANSGVYSVTSSGLRYEYGMQGEGVYGIQYDIEDDNPDVLRIGDMGCHATLPVQSKMRRCILDDEGNVVYYLDAQDSNYREDGKEAVLDGTDGQYMVEIPEHYRSFESIGNVNKVLISLNPFIGSHRVDKAYYSAVKPTIDRDDNKLSSVVSLDPKYRGGIGSTSRDDFLGKPATSTSLANFKIRAKNRGEDWVAGWYSLRATVYWLITTEYATRNHIKPVDGTLTPEGYRKGGLGHSATLGSYGVSNSDWSEYNGYYPVVPCGTTNELGNQTGEVNLVIEEFYSDGRELTVPVSSYRGIELFFGELYEFTDGVAIHVDGEEALAYVATSNNFDHTKINGRYMDGYLNNTGYIREIVFGEHGDVLVSRNGGNTSQYFTDYHTKGDSGIRAVAFGGRLSTSASAGSLHAYAHWTFSFTNASYGSRLCFVPKSNTRGF